MLDVRGKLGCEALECNVLVMFNPLRTLILAHSKVTDLVFLWNSLELLWSTIFSDENTAVIERLYFLVILHVLKEGDKWSGNMQFSKYLVGISSSYTLEASFRVYANGRGSFHLVAILEVELQVFIAIIAHIDHFFMTTGMDFIAVDASSFLQYRD